MKPFAALTIVLLSALTFIGCSSVDMPRRPSSAELQRQRDSAVDKAVYEESLRKSYESFYTNQKSEVERLRVENEALKQFQRTNTVNEQSLERLLGYLRINDYLVENHEEIVKHFNSQYSEKREALFSATGTKGKVRGFEVDDVFFYKGLVIVSSVFLWENTDASGGVGRCTLSLDPDKNLDAVGCSMNGQTALTSQELASVLQDGNNAGLSSAQLEHAAAQVPVQTSSSIKPLLSEGTKDKLIDAGIGVVSAWLLNRLLNQ
jgi:hypothetical protein